MPWEAGGRANRPGVPCSRLQSIRAFPKGSKGFAPETDRHKGKASHATIRARISCAPGSVSAQQVEDLTKQFTAVIEGLGGKVTKNEYWGVKSLNFRIRKNRKAHFTLLNVDAPPAAADRDRAPAAHQRRRAALSDRARRGARGRSVGDDAQGRPRPRSRRRAAAASAIATAAASATVTAATGSRRPRRPWRPRRDRGDRPRATTSAADEAVASHEE